MQIVTTELIAECERMLAEKLSNGRAVWLITEIADKLNIGHSIVRQINKKTPSDKQPRRRGPAPNKKPKSEPYQPPGPKPPSMSPRRRYRRCPTCGGMCTMPCYECSISLVKEIRRFTRPVAARG